MSSACTPVLVGVVPPVSEIKLAYGPWSWKNSIDRNRLKKFMQLGVDVKCMHTSFGGRGPSGFGDKISIWSMVMEKFNRLESTQKIHATRGRCQVHAHQFWWV